VTAGKFAPLLKQTLSEDAWGSLVEEPGAAMDSDMWEMFIGAVRERELEALNDRQVSASISLRMRARSARRTFLDVSAQASTSGFFAFADCRLWLLLLLCFCAVQGDSRGLDRWRCDLGATCSCLDCVSGSSWPCR